MKKEVWQSLWVYFVVFIASILFAGVMQPLSGGALAACYILGGMPVATAYIYYAIISTRPSVSDSQVRTPINKGKVQEMIIQLRKQHSLSQDELGDKVHVSGRTVRRWENGTASPSVDDIINICNAFNLSLDNLFRSEQNNNPNS